MNDFESRVIPFIKPILWGQFGVQISSAQTTALAAWLSLITVLHEYSIDDVCISPQERAYLKRKGTPPENWVIFIAGAYGPQWERASIHCAFNTFTYSSNLDLTAGLSGTRNNSQCTSFGMGKLFAHIFSTPNWKILRDFEVADRSRGLTQIWPAPRVIWPFAHGRTKLPPKLTLSDSEAFIVADSFTNRANALSGPFAHLR